MKSPYTWKDIEQIIAHPHLLGHLCGKTKLTEMHSEWMKWCLFHNEKRGLLAHRASYKSTAITEVGVILCFALFPDDTIAIVRKSYTMAAEMVREIMNMAETPAVYYFLMHCWYADKDNTIPDDCLKPLFNLRREGSLNLTVRKTHTKEASITAMGINGNFTGMHVNRLILDDVTGYTDRIYEQERSFTKMMLNELLSNILNRDMPAAILGTVWHREDALMVAEREMGIPFQRFPVDATGLMTEEQIEEAKRTQTGSLFDCNYNLSFSSTADMIFADPHYGSWDAANGKRIVAHIDASFGGEDTTALTIAMELPNDKINMVGFLFKKHIKDALPEILSKMCLYNARELWMECNGDQGYTLKTILEDPTAKSYGIWGHEYRETQNKQIKISTYLYDKWHHIQWDEKSDLDYMNQVLDWTETTKAHDDAPDSAASILREAKLAKPKNYMALYR